MILLPHYVLAENKNTNLENGNILHIWALYRHSTVSTSAVSFGGCNILQKKTFVPRADFFLLKDHFHRKTSLWNSRVFYNFH